MEWKEVRLGDIATMQYGKLAPKKKDAGNVPIFTGYKNVGYTDKINCNKNTIVVVARGVGGCGDVKITNEDCYLTNLAISVSLNAQICVPMFFYYLHQLENLSILNSGSAQPQITIESLTKYSFRIPSLDDQHRIASILSSLDRKIELNNKINADLEEMAQAIFKNWFVDFEPFKDGKFVDSELGMIPEGWKVGSPYEYAKVVYGAPYKSAKFNDNGEGLPLIRIRDLKDCNPQFYTPEILPQTEYVNMGDIVAGMDAEFVPHIWKGNTGLLNQRVCKLMPQQTSISNLFVLYLMKPELEFVQSYKTGTTVSHLGKADIDKFVVVLPPLEVVEECSKILDSILQRIKNISAESRTLSLLRDTLLPRLMSGELEIPE